MRTMVKFLSAPLQAWDIFQMFQDDIVWDDNYTFIKESNLQLSFFRHQWVNFIKENTQTMHFILRTKYLESM